jgi:hypothetical protein
MKSNLRKRVVAQPVLVYVPCKLPTRDGEPAMVESWDGRRIAVSRGHFTIVDGRLCLTATWLGGGGAVGRHRVRFADGVVVEVGRGDEWKYTPDGSEPFPGDVGHGKTPASVA